MSALICGSFAYDSIMVFPGRFSDQILPDQIHMLNVAFLVPETAPSQEVARGLFPREICLGPARPTWPLTPVRISSTLPPALKKALVCSSID